MKTKQPRRAKKQDGKVTKASDRHVQQRMSEMLMAGK